MRELVDLTETCSQELALIDQAKYLLKKFERFPVENDPETALIQRPSILLRATFPLLAD